ncbi:hypothetical protein B0H21DRAFT_882170 [Amylocystis lapponica]|nr:hypothetical protein B0H21DRAFT_882170 [Amylocystis lapponica]
MVPDRVREELLNYIASANASDLAYLRRMVFNEETECATTKSRIRGIFGPPSDNQPEIEGPESPPRELLALKKRTSLLPEDINDAERLVTEKNDIQPPLKKVKMRMEVLLSAPRHTTMTTSSIKDENSNVQLDHIPIRSFEPAKKEEETIKHMEPDIDMSMEDEEFPRGDIADENVAVDDETDEDIPEEDVFRRRLTPIGLDSFPITLDPTLRSVGVERAFVSSRYGGSAQGLYPTVKPITRATGAERWAAAHKMLVRSSAKNYLYMGEYELSLCDEPLTVEEYGAMDSRIGNSFSKLLFKREEDKDIRAYLSLKRSLKREPRREEVEAELASGRPARMRSVLHSGRIIALWRLKCIGYDEEFQRELAANSPETSQNGKSKISKTL